MKLYAGPGYCSMSCHIALVESRLPFDLSLVDNNDPSTWDPIEKLNPMGAVPVLTLDDGKALTQNIAILNYVAERAPEAGLLPKVGTFERAETFQWLSWVASDLHPAIGTLFDATLTSEARKEALDDVDRQLSIADRQLAERTFVAGHQFTAADCYLFTVYSWTNFLKVPMDRYRNLNAYAARLAERPSVQAVLKREGLVK